MASALRARARRAAPALGGGPAPRGFAKTSTGIVGLEVVPNGRAVLMALSEKLLRMVAELPETAHYRKTVEQVYTARLEACRQHTEVEAIEAALGLGQIEELIKVAQDEEKLIPKMKGARLQRHRGAPGFRAASGAKAGYTRCSRSRGRCVRPARVPAGGQRCAASAPRAAGLRAGVGWQQRVRMRNALGLTRPSRRRVEAVGGS